MKVILKALALACAGLAIGFWLQPVTVRAASSQPLSNTSLALCKNQQFALCAASTCTPTGRKILVNTPTGGKRLFPEAVCTCPVLPEGETGAIANLRGGNMNGSCDSAPGTVWSLYSLAREFPQQAYGWNVHEAALNTSCTADLNLGRRYANCFSFRCDNIRTIKAQDGSDVTVSDCHCPLGEDVFSALPTKPATAFFTEAGGTTKDPQAFCYKTPVGGF